MSHIEAIYRRGVFEPLGPVNLREEQRVQLSFDAANGSSPESWLARVRALQAVVVARQGFLPDSTTNIAGDRMR